MYTDLILAVLFCLGIVVFAILASREKKDNTPPVMTGTMPSPPEPTPEETGPPVDQNNEYVEPDVTPIPHTGPGYRSTPTDSDVNNEQLEKLD